MSAPQQAAKKKAAPKGAAKKKAAKRTATAGGAAQKRAAGKTAANKKAANKKAANIANKVTKKKAAKNAKAADPVTTTTTASRSSKKKATKRTAVAEKKTRKRTTESAATPRSTRANRATHANGQDKSTDLNGSAYTNGHDTSELAAHSAASGHEPVQVPCLSCGLCCTYIAVDIDPPTTVRRATQMLWYLYHGQVSVYWDHEDEWLLQFETRCRHLGPDRKCGIYAQRPHICRDFDESSCEVNALDEGTSFHTPSAFLEFLKERKRPLYKKLEDGGYVPDDAALTGPPADRSRLAPFEGRFRRLRVLGGHQQP